MFKQKKYKKILFEKIRFFSHFIRIFSQKFAFIRDESENKIINANFREFLKNALKFFWPFFGISKNERIRIFSQFFCEFARIRDVNSLKIRKNSQNLANSREFARIQ
mgnify:CR=1 FL=1